MTQNSGLDDGNRSRLVSFLSKHGLNASGSEITIDLISGGRSNLTYKVTTAEQSFVLRRPPLGHVLATAHDMSREYRVIEGLSRPGCDVPVPKPILLSDDETVLGVPFYLMEYVPGYIVRTVEQAQSLSSAAQREIGEDLVDVLAALHTTDPEAVGLADFGRPAGFMERQVRRWVRQLADSRSREINGIDRLAEVLGGSVPEQRYNAIVHGDYRLDNCLLRDSHIAAVLDWEMSTLGDPLSDLGLFTVYHAGLAGIDNPVVQAFDGVGSFPSITDLHARYAAKTGFNIDDLPWYTAFAWFKFAVILEGIHYRGTLGATRGDGFEGVSELVQPSVDRGLEALASAK
ncbi:MAG: phosphotransferase family protein [Leucobacter sp.]|nr:phosphotransferase family protein [Leucobacter sp.]